jgi:hypothetical protein
MIWVFVVVAALAVFAIAAATVGREAFRLGHQPPPTIFDLDEAVHYVADDLPEDAQARLTYDEVRLLVLAEVEHLRAQGVLGLLGEEPDLARPHRASEESEEREAPATPGPPGRPGAPGAGNGTPVVVADDDAVAVVLGRAEAEGIEVSDDDVFLVVSSLHRYLAEIGAVGPTV